MRRLRRAGVGWGLLGAGAATWTTALAGQELELVHTVGLQAEPVLGAIEDAALLSDGRLVVLDEQARALHWFDAEGSYLREVSREGQGPGEIGGASDLAVDDRDRVHLLDYRNLRVSTWDADGEFLSGTPLSELLPTGGYPVALHADGSRLYLKSMSFDTPSRNAISTLRVGEAGEVTVEARLVEWSGDEPSCTFCDWSPRGDGVAAAAGDTLYLVRELRPGGDVGAVWERDDLPAAAMTSEEARERWAQVSRRVSLEGGVPESDGPVWHHRFTRGRIAWRDDGTLWLAPRLPTDSPGIFDIFSEDGKRLRTLRLTHPVERFSLGADRVAIVDATPIGEPLVRVYRIR